MAEVEESGDRRPASEQRVRSGQSVLASELGGDLPCVRCRYNLRGLSVRGLCPECATPVRATLLAVVDPMATELRPIPRPMLTATGLLVGSIAALGAALCIWMLRISDFLPVGVVDDELVRLMSTAAIGFVGMSGLGSIALIKPHAGILRRNSMLAVMSVLLHAPLVWLMMRVHMEIDQGMEPYTGPVNPVRVADRLIVQALMAAIILGLRPNARILVARSLLLRSGRVDRQTLFALVAVLIVSALGDALLLTSLGMPGPTAEITRQIGRIIVLIGSLLFTIGLVGVVVDCWRLRPVIVAPPLSLSQLLGNDQVVNDQASAGAGSAEPRE